MHRGEFQKRCHNKGIALSQIRLELLAKLVFDLSHLFTYGSPRFYVYM